MIKVGLIGLGRTGSIVARTLADPKIDLVSALACRAVLKLVKTWGTSWIPGLPDCW